MSVFSVGFSAIGKLLTVVFLAVAFLLGLGGVMYLSLQGKEVKVPEIVGKNFGASQDELESLGLRIKKRADRYSEEAPDTVLEQLPKPGETVKTGQLIFVVVSKSNPEGEDKPATIKREEDKGDTEKIEDLISEKPKKKNSNTNVNGASNSAKKDGDTSRDTIAPGDAALPANGKPSDSDSDNKEAKPSPTTPKATPASSPKAAPKAAGETRPKRVQ